MNDVLEQYRRNSEEMKLAAMVWWLIIWYASDEGKLEIPSEQEWLTCELVASLIEEETGEKFWYSWRHDEFERERCHQWNEWPERLNVEMDRCDRYHHAKFDGSDPKGIVRGLLKRFAQQRFAYERSEKWYDSDLKLFHEHTTPTACGHSRFTPHREMYNRAMAYLTEHEAVLGFDRIDLLMDWLCRIGMIIMRPYVVRDITFIKSHYSW